MAYTEVNHQFLIEAYADNVNNGDHVDVSNYVTKIAVDRNYESNIFPLFVISLNAPLNIREMFRVNNIKLNLVVYQYSVNLSNDNADVDNPVIENIIIKTTIRLFDKNISEIVTKNTSLTDDETDATSNQRFSFDLSGIPDDLLQFNDDVINKVYLKASNNEIIADLLSGSSKLFIDNSDNNAREDTLLIPSLNRSKAIEYLDLNYSIYDSPYSLFFDVDMTYLTKLYASESTYHINKFDIEYKNVNDISSAQNYNYAQIDEDNNIRMYKTASPIAMNSKDVITNALGGNAVFSSYGEDFEIVTRSHIIDESNSKVRHYWNCNQSKLFEDAHSNTPRSFTSLIVSNLNPMLINPTTQVNIKTNDENISGSYTITDCRFILSSSNFKNYSSTFILSLAK